MLDQAQMFIDPVFVSCYNIDRQVKRRTTKNALHTGVDEYAEITIDR